jgi:hypothetical protein
MIVSLQDWLNNDWLVEHDSSREEIADLLSIVERDLTDCQSPGLSADWRLAIAYNAALQIALAGLALAGYRVAREAHHFRAIQSLSLTLGCDDDTVSQLDAFRKKRNISDYERAGNVSDQEASEIYQLAKQLYNHFLQWTHQRHPQLLP